MIDHGNSTVTIVRPDNWHAHYRRGLVLKMMVDLFMRCGWGRVLAMPNIPILDADQMVGYRDEIMGAITGDVTKRLGNDEFQPVMTIQITPQTTPKMVFAAKKSGAIAGKVYPRYVTTNSEHGVVNYPDIYPALEAMQECGMVAQFHPEHPSNDIEGVYKEPQFWSILWDIIHKFPDLKISAEHLTTGYSVEQVLKAPDNVCASITVHHLALTLDDVIGYNHPEGKNGLRPDNYCKPIAKMKRDRNALIEAATSGNPKFFYGGDDAPHTEENKYSACGCAGVFNTRVALPALVQLFEQAGKLMKLENFTSQFGADFYGFPPNEGTVTLVKKDWVVPESERPGHLKPVPNWLGGETLRWKLKQTW